VTTGGPTAKNPPHQATNEEAGEVRSDIDPLAFYP
jgi:hypothetical protein